MDSPAALPEAAALTLAASGFMPAAEVVSALAKSPLPREGKAAMTALSTETLIGGPPSWPYKWSPFRCEFGFHEWTGSLATFPEWGGNAEFKTHAIGVWQDQPDTYREIAALTGNAGFEPRDQITNNWALAVRDYGKRTGGNLLADLMVGDAAHLAAVQKGLFGTWPGGANESFPARYIAALTLFPSDAPGLPPSSSALEIPLGQQCMVAILSATDDTGAPVADIPADVIVPDDSSICSASVSGSTLVIKTFAVGTTTLRGADQEKVITVEPRGVAHLVIDWEHPVFSPMTAAAKAIVAHLPMLAMAGALLMMAATAAGPPGQEKPPKAEISFFPELPTVSVPAQLCPPRDLRWLLIPSPCGR